VQHRKKPQSRVQKCPNTIWSAHLSQSTFGSKHRHIVTRRRIHRFATQTKALTLSQRRGGGVHQHCPTVVKHVSSRTLPGAKIDLALKPRASMAYRAKNFRTAPNKPPHWRGRNNLPDHKFRPNDHPRPVTSRRRIETERHLGRCLAAPDYGPQVSISRSRSHNASRPANHFAEHGQPLHRKITFPTRSQTRRLTSMSASTASTALNTRLPPCVFKCSTKPGNPPPTLCCRYQD